MAPTSRREGVHCSTFPFVPRARRPAFARRKARSSSLCEGDIRCATLATRAEHGPRVVCVCVCNARRRFAQCRLRECEVSQDLEGTVVLRLELKRTVCVCAVHYVLRLHCSFCKKETRKYFTHTYHIAWAQRFFWLENRPLLVLPSPREQPHWTWTLCSSERSRGRDHSFAHPPRAVSDSERGMVEWYAEYHSSALLRAPTPAPFVHTWSLAGNIVLDKSIRALWNST